MNESTLISLENKQGQEGTNVIVIVKIERGKLNSCSRSVSIYLFSFENFTNRESERERKRERGIERENLPPAASL